MRKALLLIVILSTLLLSCRSHQELAYYSDAPIDSAQAIVNTYNTTIHPGDQLYIYVYSQAPDAALAFNQETRSFVAEVNKFSTLDTSHRSIVRAKETATEPGQMSTSQVDGYLVTQEGVIQFPVLGKLSVAGITQDSLSRLIQARLINEGYLLDPVVTVAPMNFRVSVIGEVRTPQEIHVTGDRFTILEALAKCGDITMYGQRENVVVLRDRNGVATPIEIDLTKKTLFDSEVYYLQSNDIVYIEPNKVKKRKADENAEWPRYISTGVSFATAIYTILRAETKILKGLRRTGTI